MKKIIYITSLFLVLLTSVPLRSDAGDLLMQAGAKIRSAGDKIFVDVGEEKKQKRIELQQEKAKFEEENEKLLVDTNSRLAEVDREIETTKAALRRTPADEFLNKKVTILNELYQGIKDIQKSREQLVAMYDEHIKLLTSYIEDSTHSKFKKEHKFKDYLIYYSFDDLHRLYQEILDQERRVVQLTEQINNAKTELGHRKQSSAAAAQVFAQKREAREAAVKASEGQGDTQYAIELLNLEEQLFNNRNKLDELHLKEIEEKINLLETRKFIAEGQLRVLKDELRRIKPSIRVTETDVLNAKQELANQRKKRLGMQDVYRQRISVVLAEKQEQSKALETLSKRYNISLDANLDTWRVEPPQTVVSYVGLSQVGALNAYILLLEAKRRLLEELSTLESVAMNNEAVQVQVKESFYKIASRAFGSEDAIAQEIKKYDAPKAEARANITLFKAEMQNVGERIETQKKILDTIAELRQDIQSKQARLFKNAGKEYLTCIEMFARAERSVKERMDVFKQMNDAYARGIEIVERTIRQINFIVSELNAITIWYRPEYAISWEGVKNMVGDVEVFFADVAAYVQRLDIDTIFVMVKDMVKQPMVLIWPLLQLCIALLVLFILRIYLPTATHLLLSVHSERGGVVRMFFALLAAILGFIYTYYISLVVWGLFFVASVVQFVVLDPYIYILFYLVSIPYLLLLANRFVRYITNFNEQQNYVILSQEFQHRFMLVFSTLLYATIIISFFRESFEVFRWTKNYKSELSNILFAINYIIFQIGLIFLISKEQILNIIPEKNIFGHWLHEQVDRYYALLLLVVITIIVMINPYVGFGSLVWYVLKGLFLTGLLAYGLVWLYGLFKNTASRVFFAREDEVVRERFSHAKTWFGLLIIALFLLVTIFGVVVCAHIWGWPITLKEVIGWLNEPLIPGMTPPINVIAFFKLIAFILSGFLVSYALDRFVLDKIFDLLLIDMGVQHTVNSITRYLIVVTAVFLGLQNVGLGNIVVWIIGALALGVGWILKEPISDFVSYFIILVQRPLKIGDFIQIDDNTVGVVRKITPRSVVLRRKNSTTIVVPNSYVVNHSIVNWNYIRKFIAFNDIYVLIHYTEDPVWVRQLLFEAVESHSKILKNPRPLVRLDEFAEYGYRFMVRGFLSDVYTLDQWDIASEVRLAIVKKLKENGIMLAVPVRVYVNPNKPDASVQPTGAVEEGKGMKE